jgi:hypothetical protein
VVPEEREVTIRRCCCNDCGSADCSAVREDCAAVGLRPFTVWVGISMRKASCDDYIAHELFCDNENCADWGEVPCGGCTPCDPTGSLPGANGRTCPCMGGMCQKPPGRHWPWVECVGAEPLVRTDGCRYGHPDYWYLTFREPTNDPCDVPTEPPCPWLGSVSCAFDLVRVPAGYSEVPCGTLSGEIQNQTIGSLAKCNAPGSWTLPWPTEAGHYGWPHDCDFSPPPCGVTPDNGCMCQCVGVFPTWLLSEEENLDCDPSGTLKSVLYARINWAVPCASGSDFGGILACGDQCPCDTDQYSYVSVTFFGSSIRHQTNVVGDGELAYIDPNDPEAIAALCQSLVGDTSTVPPGSSCDAGNQFTGLLCDTKCCTCQFQETVIFRKARNPAMSGYATCKMALGRYDIVGYGPCGDLNWTSCNSKTCAHLLKCAPNTEWEQELQRIGLTDIRFEVTA